MTVKFQLTAKNPQTTKADVLVVVVDDATFASPLFKALEKSLGGGLKAHLDALEFSAEKGGVAQVPSLGKAVASHLVFVGVRTTEGGDGARFGERARLCAAVATGVRTSLGLKAATLNVVTPPQADLRAVAEGVVLGAYTFGKYHTKASNAVDLELVQVLQAEAISDADKKAFARGLAVAEGVCMARDLVNEPPNVLTPEEFAKRARAVAKKRGFSAKILDHKGIQDAGMNLHYAVGKGSENLPYFIHLTYKPAKARGRLAFIGKGITFDSGGLCIKPGPSMLGMKTDMSGAAAVLGLMEAIAALKPNVEVHGIIAAAENMPDAKAYRPNDVIRSLSGKGVEVINTDAEGRMVLADALTYAARLNPDFMIDAATLTGATMISLGNPFSAFYTGSEEIAAAMKLACQEAGESFWQMPLIEEMATQLKSDITDLKHTGDGMGGAISAALFLREFTAGVPWMHCDIPGPVFRDRPTGFHPKGATGHAVLSFLKLVEMHAEKPILPPREKATAAKSEGAKEAKSGARRQAKGAAR